MVDLENVGYAEVDGFYRFPSFEPSKDERCQRGYSAFNMKRRNSRRSTATAASFAVDAGSAALKPRPKI